MKLKKSAAILLNTSILSLLITSTVFAEDIDIIGSIQHSLKEQNSHSSIRLQNNEKVIQLLKVTLSDEERVLLEKRIKEASSSSSQLAAQAQADNDTLPPSKQLGMNKVPVLDQGMHGSCVTFAITGAVDAIIGKGDYVSQLCNLQLGNYLEQQGYGLSGWNGSHPIDVINQMQQYGFMNIKNQIAHGCGGLTKYPTHIEGTPKSFIEPEQFLSMSEFVFGKTINWFDIYQRDSSEKTLTEVKEALNSGDRLAFAVLLPRIDLGTVGAVGKYKTWLQKDSWVLTPEIIKGVDSVEAAHELIITGYDDKAEAKDDKGKKHKGLLKLRNSWGKYVGDDGEFYMSYDYFKLLAYDVKRLSKSSI